MAETSPSQLVQYVKETLQQGYSEQQVRQTLLQNGYDEPSVDQTFSLAQGEGQQKALPDLLLRASTGWVSSLSS